MGTYKQDHKFLLQRAFHRAMREGDLDTANSCLREMGEPEMTEDEAREMGWVISE